MGNILIIKNYVDLVQHGREYIGLCPFHKDDKPSLKVNPEKNIFKCFACGKGGSAAHFIYEWNKLKGTKIKLDVTNDDIKVKPKENLDDWKIVTPVPSFVEQPSYRHINLGVPSQVFRWTDIFGRTMFYTCRFNLKDGDKEVLPYTFCVKGNQTKWTWRGLSKDRPLYGLNRFIKNDKPIVLVEGEGKVDVGYDNCDEFNFACWQGGSNAYRLTDFSPLKGRNVILLQDNDKVGMEAMDGISEIIKPFVNEVYRIKELKDKPIKWDIKDHKWSKGELYEFIKSNIIR